VGHDARQLSNLLHLIQAKCLLLVSAGSRVCWMGDLDRICTTGFSKMSDRQIFVWDTRNLSKPSKTVVVDTSSGTLMPFFSVGNNMLFFAGKGDGNVRYYEYEKDELYPLAEYKSSEPQRGMTFMPPRALNTHECEIARAYKVGTSSIYTFLSGHSRLTLLYCMRLPYTAGLDTRHRAYLIHCTEEERQLPKRYLSARTKR
jgi:WD40 repeat protein